MGALSKNNAKIGGLKLKLLLLQGGPNFHFMSCTFVLNCKNNSTCIVKQENDLRKCEVYVKKMSSHFRHVTRGCFQKN